MQVLNATRPSSSGRFAPHAVTDVTGFGLLGHAHEIATRSGVAIELDAGALPALPGALELAAAGVRTGGDPRNRDFVGDALAVDGASDAQVALAFDPQTAGGLLVSLPAGARRGARGRRRRARRVPRADRLRHPGRRASAHLIRSCRLKRRWPGDQTRSKRAALEADRPDEDAVVVCQPVGADRLPHVPRGAPPAGTASARAVRRGSDPRATVRDPCRCICANGSLNACSDGLRAVVREDEPGLEAAEHELVAVEVLEQHRDPRQPPRAHRGEADHVRLPLERDAEERVRRIRLVAVLGQPDRLRPEGALDEDEELPDRRHRDRGAGTAAAAGRRLGRRRGVRVVGVGVELRVGGGHAADPGDGCDASQPAARRRHAAADPRVRQHGMDRLVAGVEQMLDVDRRLRRPEPEALVRLVPDQPVANPRVALGGGAREAAEVLGAAAGRTSARAPRSPTPASRPA